MNAVPMSQETRDGRLISSGEGLELRLRPAEPGDDRGGEARDG